MGIFSGVGKVTAFGSANYMGPGSYWVRIDRCKKAMNSSGIPLVVIEGTVVRRLEEDSRHRVGESVCHCISRAAKYDFFFRDALGFLSAVYHPDMTKEQVLALSESEKEAALEEIFSDAKDNPVIGMVLHVVAYHRVDKETGKPKKFTTIEWRPGQISMQELRENLSPEEMKRFFNA